MHNLLEACRLVNVYLGATTAGVIVFRFHRWRLLPPHMRLYGLGILSTCLTLVASSIVAVHQTRLSFRSVLFTLILILFMAGSLWKRPPPPELRQFEQGPTF